MSLRLDQPFAIGDDFDEAPRPDQTHAKITRMTMDFDRNLVIMQIDIGTEVDGEFTKSMVGRSMELSGAEFAAAAMAQSLDGETLEGMIKRIGYGAIMEEFPRLAGTVV